MDKIFVFIFDGMTDYEITFITHLLGVDAGKQIITIAYKNRVIKSRSGLSYLPDRLVSDVRDEDAAGLIICGGWYGDIRDELVELINKLNDKGRLLGGICGAGTVFLAKAGVLKDVKYTTPAIEWTNKHVEVFGERDPFPRENLVSERVMRDKNIITARGEAFVDFAIEICDWFNLFDDKEDKCNFTKFIKGN